MAAISAAVKVPATVKCRVGVDDQDPEESLFGLVDQCVQAGVRHFVVHARKAHLQEAEVICCVGSSIVADVIRKQSGRSGRHRHTPIAPQYASKVRLGGFRMLATPVFLYRRRA